MRLQWWMFLARTVFHCSAFELPYRITNEEFTLWMAEYDQRPWGDEWLQTGTITAAVVNSNPYRKKKRGIKPTDVMPGGRSRRWQSDDEIRSGLDSFFAARKASADGKKRKRGND